MHDGAAPTAMHVLGVSAAPFEVATRDALAEVCLAMASQARRTLDIVSRHLDAPLFDNEPFVAAVKQSTCWPNVSTKRRWQLGNATSLTTAVGPAACAATSTPRASTSVAESPAATRASAASTAASGQDPRVTNPDRTAASLLGLVRGIVEYCISHAAEVEGRIGEVTRELVDVALRGVLRR